MARLKNKIWRFLSEFSGVISSLYFIYLGVSKAIAYLLGNNLIFLFIFFIIVLIVTLISNLKWISNKYNAFISLERNIAIKEEINNISRKGFNINLEKKLPTTDLLKKIYREAKKRALYWSDDAVLTSFNIFIHITSKSTNLVFQTFFYSNWKDETKIEYFGSLEGDNLREGKVYYDRKEVKPFFETLSTWRNAVVKSYESIFSQIPNNFRIQLSTCKSKKEMGITFHYNQGKVERIYNFEFKNKTLINKKSDKKIVVK